MVYFWASEGNLRALYPNMSEVDRSAAYEQLVATDIPVSLDSRSGSLMVPTERYYEARMLLASAGLPAQSNLTVARRDKRWLVDDDKPIYGAKSVHSGD
jgi:flagellar biosynthesis/type III secretory pathway M-ring protein FliF/YscJ